MVEEQYEEVLKGYSDKIKNLEMCLKSLDGIETTKSEIKKYSKIEFLTWYTGKNNQVKKLEESMKSHIKLSDIPLHKTENFFSKDNELSHISKLIYSKSPLDVLRTKYEVNSLNRDYRMNTNRNGLNK